MMRERPPRRAQCVAARETIEAEDRGAARCEAVRGRAAVGSEPRDDDVDRHQ